MIEIYTDEESIHKMPWYWTSQKDCDGAAEEFSISCQLYAQMMGWA